MLLQILRWNIIRVRDPIERARLTTQMILDLPVEANTAFQFRESGWLHWTKFRRRTYFGSQICMYCRVYAHSRSSRKGFYRYEFNFHTNSSTVLSLSLFLSLSLSLSFFLSLSLSLSLSLFLFQQHSTNRVLRANADVVCRVLREEQGWRALQYSAVPRLVIRNPIKPGDTGEI